MNVVVNIFCYDDRECGGWPGAVAAVTVLLLLLLLCVLLVLVYTWRLTSENHKKNNKISKSLKVLCNLKVQFGC